MSLKIQHERAAIPAEEFEEPMDEKNGAAGIADMKVTFGPLDRYKKTYVLYLNDEPWRTVHLSIFGSRPSISASNFHELEAKGAKAFALRRLSQRSYHSKKLEEILKERYVSSDTINELLKEFKEKEYLDDSLWLQASIRSLRNQKIGFKAIQQKLQYKGIDPQEIEAAIDQFKEEVEDLADEQTSIAHLLSTRYKNRQLNERKHRDKVIAALLRKGYSLSQILEEIKAFMPNHKPSFR